MYHTPGAVPLSPTSKENAKAAIQGATNFKVSLIFAIEDGVGAFDKVISILRELSISLSRIESRPSRTADWDYDIFIEFKVADDKVLATLLERIKPVVKNIHIINSDGNVGPFSSLAINSGPWFPRSLRDLDSFADKTLEYGEALEADHPGFNDAVYRQRRAEITAIAKTYKTGQEIPRIEYSRDENETWKKVYLELKKLYPTHACNEHNYIFPLLERNCGYGPEKIPQLEDVSRFLKECTGFSLRPVMGLLSSRDFLNALAFRVFYSTQYIRHHSKPFYTPEPDVCHELLGHVPLFASASFADFSQEIGLCSLGASDADIEKLATIYWFTVEFGLCRQGGDIKAYGAGLLSSFGELEYCINSDKPQRLPFQPEKVAIQKYPITEYQPVYFVAESFKAAQQKVREFSHGLERPFAVRYNPFTQTIETLDSKEKIISYTESLKSEMSNLIEALRHL